MENELNFFFSKFEGGYGCVCVWDHGRMAYGFQKPLNAEMRGAHHSYSSRDVFLGLKQGDSVEITPTKFPDVLHTNIMVVVYDVEAVTGTFTSYIRSVDEFVPLAEYPCFCAQFKVTHDLNVWRRIHS